MDAAVLLDAEERVAAWPNVTDSDVVSEVLSGYQIPVQVDDTSVLYDEDRQLLIQRGTDWRFLQHLARAQRRPLLLRVRRRARSRSSRTSPRPTSAARRSPTSSCCRTAAA